MEVRDAASIYRELQRQLENQLAGAGRDPDQIVRAEIELSGLDAADWLAAQAPGPRGYWSDRDEDFQLAGIGRADAIIGNEPVDFERLFDQLHQRVDRVDGNLRYFGGCCFDQQSPHDERWKHFGSYRFILPRCEVLTRQGRTVCAVNMRADESLTSIVDELRKVQFSTSIPESRLPTLQRRCEEPDRSAWMSEAASLIEQIDAGSFDKVVLARRIALAFDARLDSAQLLRALKAATANSFHFCFQPNATQAFLGASPERLFRRDGTRVLTEAIAGTRVRGQTRGEDARLRIELQESVKEQHEHRIVVDVIRERLATLSRNIRVDEHPSVLALKSNQHLRTRVQAELKDGVTDAELLCTLHPTPAVAGKPNDVAMRLIREREPFDRGWYAGPVGWVSRDASQFAVGIRSGLLDGEALFLFAGAGLVTRSKPGAEWDEIEHKLDDFMALFHAST